MYLIKRSDRYENVYQIYLLGRGLNAYLMCPLILQSQLQYSSKSPLIKIIILPLILLPRIIIL